MRQMMKQCNKLPKDMGSLDMTKWLSHTHTHTRLTILKYYLKLYVKEDYSKYQILDSSDLRKKRSNKRDKCNNFGDQ